MCPIYVERKNSPTAAGNRRCQRRQRPKNLVARNCIAWRQFGVVSVLALFIVSVSSIRTSSPSPGRIASVSVTPWDGHAARGCVVGQRGHPQQLGCLPRLQPSTGDQANAHARQRARRVRPHEALAPPLRCRTSAIPYALRLAAPMKRGRRELPALRLRLCSPSCR